MKTTEHGIEDSRDVALGKGHNALGKELRRRIAAVQGRIGALKRSDAQGTGAGHAGAGPSRSESGASDAGRIPTSKPRVRWEYPDLVTLEPADDEMFGEAGPLVVEWRGLKAAHANDGKSLDWLRTEERFLALELALLEEHGMTLPPARFPLRDFDRNGQVNWRQTALFDTRRAIRKRDLLNRLSFGLLWW